METTNKQTKPAKTQTFDLDTIKVDALAEIKGKKETLKSIIKANPFVTIEDTASYEQAKKNRTALRTGRTDVEKEEKTLLNKIKNNLTDPIKNIYAEFKEQIRPAEDKQQDEVSRWEGIKEQERLDKLKAEEERKQKHIDNINKFYETTKSKIDNLNYSDSVKAEVEATYEGMPIPNGFFEEFETMYEAKVEMLKMHLIDRKRTLQQQEDIRLENERLAKERAENERKQAVKSKIETWYSQWENNIENFMEFEDIERVTNEFQNQEQIEVAEFTGIYEERKNLLVKKLETRTSLLTQQEDQRKKDEEYAEQQRDLERQRRVVLTDKRKLQLLHLGFDNELAYSQNGLRILFPIEDILCDDAEWENFIVETEAKIAESKLPKPEPEEIEVNEAEEITQDIVQDVDFEDEPDDTILTETQRNAQSIVFGFYNYCMDIDGELREYHIYNYIKTL